MKLIRLHPLITWQRVDANRLQLRVPSGQHVTFDQNAELIESLLIRLRQPATGAELATQVVSAAEQHEFLTQLLEFFGMLGVITDDAGASDRGAVISMLDFFARTTEFIRVGIPNPYLKQAQVVGTGAIADAVRGVLEHEASLLSSNANEGKTLDVVCADSEDLPLFRKANAEAVAVARPATFVTWNGTQLVVGPLVIPGDSSCFECAVARRISMATHVDETRALLTKPVETAAAFRSDLVFEGLVRFAVGRHLGAVARGLFQMARPGYVESWDPLGSSTVSRVLKVPRCGVCGRSKPGASPARSIRDLW